MLFDLGHQKLHLKARIYKLSSDFFLKLKNKVKN